MARDLERNLAAVQGFEKTTTNIDLILQPGTTLSGSVKDVQGAPVDNAVVELRFRPATHSCSWNPHRAWWMFVGPGQPQNSTTNTDSQGKVHFDEVCDGPIKVFANYQDPHDRSINMSLKSSGGMEVQPGDTNILIQLW